MKRRDLERHLKNNGCIVEREGGSHSIWKNPENSKISSIPRHTELNNITSKQICKQLGEEKVSDAILFELREEEREGVRCHFI